MGGAIQRPMSVMIQRSGRSSSRLSMSSKLGGGSRASDEDGSKTAVKVAVRVRPPLKPGDPGFELIPQRFRAPTCHVTSQSSLAVDGSGGRKMFVFDRVFGEDIDQEGVFDYVVDSVHSFVQGYNVSILAYGQSGAGKSYTMGTTGPTDQGDAEIMGMFRQCGHEEEKSLIMLQVSSRVRQPHCSKSLKVPTCGRLDQAYALRRARRASARKASPANRPPTRTGSCEQPTSR
jgi:hypothetical protein